MSPLNNVCATFFFISEICIRGLTCLFMSRIIYSNDAITNGYLQTLGLTFLPTLASSVSYSHQVDQIMWIYPVFLYSIGRGMQNAECYTVNKVSWHKCDICCSGHHQHTLWMTFSIFRHNEKQLSVVSNGQVCRG